MNERYTRSIQPKVRFVQHATRKSQRSKYLEEQKEENGNRPRSLRSLSYWFYYVSCLLERDYCRVFPLKTTFGNCISSVVKFFVQNSLMVHHEHVDDVRVNLHDIGVMSSCILSIFGKKYLKYNITPCTCYSFDLFLLYNIQSVTLVTVPLFVTFLPLYFTEFVKFI